MNAGPYADAARALADTAFSHIDYRAATGSTNADASAMLGNPQHAGRTIAAGYQRNGIGRKGRSWEAPPDTALLFTTILPDDIDAQRLWLVPFWTALAVHGALRTFAIAAHLQWPNDILLRDGKLAGILCLSQVAGERARVACGVGLNVRRTNDAIAGAAYCDDVAPVEKPALLAAILRRFDETLGLLERPRDVVTLWEAAAAVPGARYRIALDNAASPFEATAVALQTGGALTVRREDETIERVEMADARILR